MENNSKTETVLLVFNRNVKLLRLVGAKFDSKVASPRSMRKKNFIIQTNLQKKVCHCFNNIVFILVAKISPKKKFVQKMENYSTLKKVLLVCNSNAELLRLAGAIFDFKVASLRRMRKKNFDNSEKFAEKKFAIFFGLFVCRLLTFELSNIN